MSNQNKSILSSPELALLFAKQQAIIRLMSILSSFCLYSLLSFLIYILYVVGKISIGQLLQYNLAMSPGRAHEIILWNQDIMDFALLPILILQPEDIITLKI